MVDATVPDEDDEEQLAKADERRYMELCRIIMYGMKGGSKDIGTPRAALVRAIRESYKHRKKWRQNAVRQPGEAAEGSNQYTMDDILSMVAEGKCHVVNKKGICGAWVPKDRWDRPKEEDYLETPETSYFRFISGIVDTIEETERLEEFKIIPAHGQAASKGSEYRNSVVALACSILWGVPDPPWAYVEELQRQNRINLDVVPDRAMRVRSKQYMERLKELRAEAREVLIVSGDVFLDQALRSGTSGMRTMSQVMKQREREVREQSNGPAQAGAASSGVASSGSAKPSPYPRAPPPPKRPRSRPPVQSVTSKADAIIEKVLIKQGLGPTSQATAAAAVAMLS